MLSTELPFALLGQGSASRRRGPRRGLAYPADGREPRAALARSLLPSDLSFHACGAPRSRGKWQVANGFFLRPRPRHAAMLLETAGLCEESVIDCPCLLWA